LSRPGHPERDGRSTASAAEKLRLEPRLLPSAIAGYDRDHFHHPDGDFGRVHSDTGGDDGRSGDSSRAYATSDAETADTSQRSGLASLLN
jgi:hypothetical protein